MAKNAPQRVSFLTLGCRANQYESDVISAKLAGSGVEIVGFGEPCDVSVINTCTVTAESDRKSRQMIRRAAAFSKHIVVTGCYSQNDPEGAASWEKVTYVCGNSEKASLAETVLSILSKEESGEEPERVVSVTKPDAKASVEMTLAVPMRTRSYIKIEDGCNNKCAYCAINTARGPVRSKLPETVIREAEQLSSAGTCEIILTGIETASYGLDLPGRKPYGHALADLICEIGRIPTVKRIGMGSLEPSVMNGYFIEKLAETPSVLPHFHLSVQSGSTRVLGMMRRRYTAESVLDAIERLRSAIPDVTLSADIIAGFPGETDEDFEETLEFIQKAKFLHLHIFPYSNRKGTEASLMKDQVPEEIRKHRARILGGKGAEIKKEILSDYVDKHPKGIPVYVLLEKNLLKDSKGHSEHFVEIKIRDLNAPVGTVIPVYLESTDGKYCYGRAY
ncbi:MAG: tRNA (N(6)-L-threonylcarbamoyladenosine(37)-C(2))-methylthiotransferase MtaB [Clostridia bacterium]|nr:tRNA (N(6)-L-threonylcarbamoyladenosine(37)-C(2))-methylthiotransferase MtaB [Clostridia bacterium]